MRRIFIIGALCLECLKSTPLWAAEISATASVQETSDSNIFRIPADLKQQLARSASDRIMTAEGLLAIDKEWHDFQIQGHAGAEYTTFSQNTDLNNLGYDVGGIIAKHGSYSSISVNALLQRRLTSYQDIRSTDRSIQSLSVISGETTRSLLGDFRMILGGDFTQSTNSDSNISISDYRRFGVRFGFGYYSPTGNMIAIEGRVARSIGLHDGLLTINGSTALYRSSYIERSIEAHLLYKPSVLLSLEGWLGVSSHRDLSVFHQDFVKPIGQIKATWSPRPTIQFSIDGERSFQTASGVISNGVRTTHAQITSVLQITGSLLMTADYKKSWATYLISVTQNGIGAGHEEQINTAEGQIIYSPGSRFAFQISASHARRTSAIINYHYSETMLSATLQARFGPSSNSMSLIPRT